MRKGTKLADFAHDAEENHYHVTCMRNLLLDSFVNHDNYYYPKCT